jgi:DHA3 family macrolide efflux protein-like MFS transporter
VFINNIHFPNLYAFVHEITTRENYGRITSLLEIQGQLTFTIAGAAAAILLKGMDGHLSFFGFETALPLWFRPWKIYEIFAVNALTYLLAFAIIYRIRSLPVAEKNIDRSGLVERVKTGLGFLLKHPLLLHFGNASLLVFLAVIVSGSYIFAIYVSNFLHRGADVYAFADMSFSLGALMAGLITTRLFARTNAVRGIIILMTVAGLMYAIGTFNRVLFVFFATQFIVGACNASVRIQRITYLFHHIPNRLLGRTNSAYFMVNVFLRLCLIGLFAFPWFHKGEDIRVAMLVFALVCWAGAIILAVYYKRLMKIPATA